MWNEILVPLIIGLTIFLLGMKIMELALHFWAGVYLKQILAHFTKTPLRGLLTGTGLTALLQSSSAVSVVTIGLVNAKAITFPRTLGIILGTNIGTCVTTELIGLNINHLALPILLISIAAWLISWAIPQRMLANVSDSSFRWIQGVRFVAMAIGGFGCVLAGMEIMQTIAPALQERGILTWFIEQSQRSLLWGILAGTALTAIIQSSAATIAITMGLASMQLVSIDLGIAIILGANIGTCATAFLASIGGSRAGQMVAWSHIILNIGGAMLFYPLIPLLQQLSLLLSDYPSGQLAHAQTIFNVVCSLLALPICYLRFFQNFSARAHS